MRKATTLAGALFTALLFASCSRGMEVALDGGPVKLAPTLADVTAQWGRENGVDVRFVSNPLATPRYGDARVTIRWMLRGDSAGRLLLPAAVYTGARFPLALSRWADAGGKCYAAPILWDAWGLSGSPAEFAWSGQGPDVEASPALDGLRAGKISLAGGEAGTRQALFWLVSAEHEAPSLDLSESLGPMAAEGILVALGSLWGTLPGDSRHWRFEDLENHLSQDGGGLLLDSYSRSRGLGSRERRDFRSLVAKGKSGNSVIASLLCAELQGKKEDARALSFIAFLLDKDVQHRLSEATGLLPANLLAPDLDPSSQSARSVMTAAVSVLPVNPRPERSDEFAAWYSAIDAALK